MKVNVHKHTWHYLILVLILGIGFISYFIVGDDRVRRFFIGLIVSVFYFLWGILHHIYNGDLNRKVVLEYLTLALFGLTIFWSYLYL